MTGSSLSLTVDPRFEGPPGYANGGYIAGTIVGDGWPSASARLLRPIPIAEPLTLQIEEDQRSLLRDGEVLAVAKHGSVTAGNVPEFVTFEDADAVRGTWPGMPFQTCFVCGAERSPDDGLRIHAGPVPGTDLFADTWVPHESLRGAHGDVGREFSWAALDCPTAWVAYASGGLGLLGTITASVERDPRPGELVSVVAKTVRVDGRKRHANSALYVGDGELIAAAETIWIDIDPGS